jgi:hypothetical protein
MSIKDNFSADEWARVVGAPMLAGMAVTAADPGGLWSVLRESAAVAGAMRQTGAAGHDTGGAEGPDTLVAEVVAEYQTSDGRDLARGVLKGEVRGKKPAEIVEAALAELGAVAALVTEKAPQDAPAYKGWLNDLAHKVAEAGKEGGLLGFGGERVSHTERATLDRLATAIG